MKDVLQPLLKQGWVKKYLDDVIVYPDSFPRLLERLEAVFQRILDMGVELNLSKCNFSQKVITFLSHIISKAGIRTNPKNIE